MGGMRAGPHSGADLGLGGTQAERGPGSPVLHWNFQHVAPARTSQRGQGSDGTCRHILGGLARAPFSSVAVGFDEEIFSANRVSCRKFANRLQP